MVRIPLGSNAYKREVAQDPEIKLINRYFERDPTNQNEQAALLSRPSLRRWISAGIGDGPIRAVYCQPGVFDDALFAVSGYDLYRIDTDETKTLCGTMDSTTLDSFVSMAATDDPFLFLCDGGTLWVYSDNGVAQGTLTVSGGNIANNDTITIGTIYYKWTSGSVDTGTPAGTAGNPWLVALGANDTAALSNMLKAINLTGTAGTTYSTATTKHTTVIATSSSSTTLVVRAITAGTGGNSIATTETGVHTAWGAATLAGGGGSSFTNVPTPDNVGIQSVGYIASFIICVVAPGFDMNGRFYWIEPFATTIDPLNFATAERAPDPCWSVNVVSDQFWLPGSTTNEVWYPTGNELIPFLKLQARVFDRGVWEGTDVKVKDTVILVDRDGVVYAIGDGPQRISTHGIEERIRRAMNTQIQAGP